MSAILAHCQPWLILLFYLVFYGFLAGLFALTMWVMLQSVDPHVPKFDVPPMSPGLMIRPCTEGLDVTFNVSQSQTWHQYVRALHQFLEPYNDSVQAWRNAACVPGRYNEQPDDGVPNVPKRACRFNRSLLGPCAGLAPHGDYGYGHGQPCVLVKVNPPPGTFWGPPPVPPQREEDAALLGPLQLFPPNGSIDLMYFPYYGKRVHAKMAAVPLAKMAAVSVAIRNKMAAATGTVLSNVRVQDGRHRM
ncbi:PREDICTED: sodium/potassium-transporting ATPase subunit beta-2 [Sturnus vulgaris]|uniref:sodium/potassium-transporting ATPase subunit beta-2 n=1 Tax=Sturnus vulgaris TaxID=9172 RepID=UPI00071A8C3F|nr:PREDICTED: sodium/potassium-transporting ATPase subunit beta-2 [Sturnus vulgaris]